MKIKLLSSSILIAISSFTSVLFAAEQSGGIPEFASMVSEAEHVMINENVYNTIRENLSSNNAQALLRTANATKKLHLIGHNEQTILLKNVFVPNDLVALQKTSSEMTFEESFTENEVQIEIILQDENKNPDEGGELPDNFQKTGIGGGVLPDLSSNKGGSGSAIPE